MTEALKHRDPDGEGFVSRQKGSAHFVHFGHRRLAIIEREGGWQPLGSSDGRWLITYNGEIYNHPELRDSLLGCGVALPPMGGVEVGPQEAVPRGLAD